ncbi:hypothetical protein [uncultured Limosilactobacillus sp.]|nr:hypothetical protein [uncultured Limosilactobacillus sp.]
MKKTKLIIPPEAREHLDFDDQTPLSMTIRHNVIDVRPSRLIDVLPGQG